MPRNQKARVPIPDGQAYEAMDRELPEKVPVDWLAPKVFEDFTALRKFKYLYNGIALPHQDVLAAGVDKSWKTASEAEFDEKYRDQVLADYSWPTVKEAQQLLEYYDGIEHRWIREVMGEELDEDRADLDEDRAEAPGPAGRRGSW